MRTSIALSLVLVVSLLISGCFDQGTDLNPNKISGLEEGILYETLGVGKLVFNRAGTVYIIDADNKTSWGLDVVIIKTFEGWNRKRNLVLLL